VTSRLRVGGICLLLIGCGDSPVAPDGSFRLIGYSVWGGPTTVEPTTTVIRTPTEWTEFVRQAALSAPSGRPEDPIPTVGFPGEMAVALAVGQRPSGGFLVRVDSVWHDGRRLRVRATEEIPCVGATVITSPMTVIAVPSTTDPVEVTWSRENRSCH